MRIFGPAIVASIVAALSGQVPEFAQQYAQRLGGAIDELASVVSRFDDDARRAGLGRSEAIQRLAGNSDRLARDRATAMTDSVDRLSRLRNQQSRLNGVGVFARSAALLSDVDPDIARGTWRDFKPALPLSADIALLMTGCFAVAFVGAALLGRGIGLLKRA